MAWTPLPGLPRPTTGTGTLLPASVPLPSWPLLLSPQALDAPVHERTDVVVTRGDGLDAAVEVQDLNGRGGLVGVRAIAHLAEVAIAPATDTTVHERADVVIAGREGLDTRSEALDRDRHQAEAASEGGVSELKEGIAPPALRSAVHQCAAEVSARGHRLCAAAEAHHWDWHPAVGRGVVPQLAVVVASPALDAATHDGTGVVFARGQHPAQTERDWQGGAAASSAARRTACVADARAALAGRGRPASRGATGRSARGGRSAIGGWYGRAELARAQARGGQPAEPAGLCPCCERSHRWGNATTARRTRARHAVEVGSLTLAGPVR